MNSQGQATHGDLLRRYRLAAGLSQEELAERAGLSVTSISGIERGGPHRPRKDTVRLLAEALGLSAAERSTLEALTRRSVPAAGLARPAAIPTNLPVPPTALVGREREVASVCALLRRPEVRLLTLTGPGGVGKTHLSMQVAEHLRGSFPDGVFFVDLAPVRDPALVVSTIAQVVGVQEAGDRPLRENLIASLQGKQVLLVLDNCEHLLPAASAVADVLARCRGLTVLSTSRARLHVRGEREVVVPPLRQEMALELFVQRAQAVKADFELAAADASTVAAICARLDGLPLAIELAAAHIKVFPPRALLARLEQRLPVLIGGPRDVPERQQTLHNTLAWSYELLDPGAQALFRRLAVFAGGCTPEAAEAVCPAPGEREMESSILEELAALMDQSLLRLEAQEPAGEPRFGMLETIREYALERLEASGGTEEMRRAHAAYYLALAEQAEPALRGADQGVWLARLEREHDNLRAALRWAQERGESEFGLRLGAMLGYFWHLRGYLHEGRKWLDGLLALDTGTTPLDVRARALRAAGALAFRQADYARATTLFQESLALSRRLGNDAGRSDSLRHLANVAMQQGAYRHARDLYEQSLRIDRALRNKRGMVSSSLNLGLVARELGNYARATAFIEESLALSREVGDTQGVAHTLFTLGLLAEEQGQFARAAALYEDSLSRARELEDKLTIAHALHNLGTTALHQGDGARAAALIEESLSLARDLGDKQGIAAALFSLGQVAQVQGTYGHSAALATESLRLFRDMGNQLGVAVCLDHLASLACAQEHWVRAARLYAATTAFRTAMGAPLAPVDRSRREHEVAALRAALGQHAFAAEWAAGQALPLEQAIAEALRDDTFA